MNLNEERFQPVKRLTTKNKIDIIPNNLHFFIYEDEEEEE